MYRCGNTNKAQRVYFLVHETLHQITASYCLKDQRPLQKTDDEW